jgi:hypothetical protein
MPKCGVVTCGTNGWSIVTSASPNSQFAGILAGFLFTALVFLFQTTGKHSPVIALFTASFLVLGFDSYLYSAVSGFSAEDNADSRTVSLVCNGVWIEGMAASGMLVVGAASLIVGLGYLLIAHDVTATYLRGLAIFTGAAILAGAPVLLLYTSFNFYEFVFAQPKWSLIYWASGGAAALTAIAGYVCFKWSHKDNNTYVRIAFLKLTSYSVAAYAFVGPAFAASLIRLPRDWIIEPNIALWVATLIVSLVLPALIIVGLAGSTAEQ